MLIKMADGERIREWKEITLPYKDSRYYKGILSWVLNVIMIKEDDERQIKIIIPPSHVPFRCGHEIISDDGKSIIDWCEIPVDVSDEQKSSLTGKYVRVLIEQYTSHMEMKFGCDQDIYYRTGTLFDRDGSIIIYEDYGPINRSYWDKK
jgi:hypothetical protein